MSLTLRLRLQAWLDDLTGVTELMHEVYLLRERVAKPEAANRERDEMRRLSEGRLSLRGEVSA